MLYSKKNFHYFAWRLLSTEHLQAYGVQRAAKTEWKNLKKNQDLHSSQHNPILRSELSSWCLTFYFCIFIIEIIEAFSSVDARNNFLWLFSLMLTEEKNSPNMVYANILIYHQKRLPTFTSWLISWWVFPQVYLKLAFGNSSAWLNSIFFLCKSEALQPSNFRKVQKKIH